MVDRQEVFFKKMDAMLSASKVADGAVRQTIKAIATEEHSYNPIALNAPDRYIVNQYWKGIMDRQRPSSRRSRRLMKDYRD